ncbi:MAG: hypothetical protein IKT00_00115 [Prevotella sp.]|nr:hypothetical protein [Prevotella sp.]
MVYTEFIKLDFYKAFERWLSSQCAEDYYHPESYNDETGELISEPYFDEDGYNRAIKNTVIAASLIYDQINHEPYKLYDKSYEELLEMAGFETQTDICQIGVYGGLFLMGLVDYPYLNDNFGIARWRGFEMCVDQWFRNCSDIHTWLTFYKKFYSFKGRSLLPKELRQNKVMEYWRRLQEKGFIDEEYQIIYSNEIKSYHVGVIANNLWARSNCKWKDLENFFLTKDGKKFKNLRTEYERRNRDDPMIREIEECF